MAITLQCPTCERQIRVKDDLAGRKIRCPECKNVVAVPRPEPADDDEAPLSPAPRSRRADDEVPKKKKKKGIFSADVNDLNQAFNNFDVRRFTLAGWLLLVIALAAGFGCAFLADMNFERVMGPRNPNDLIIKYRAPFAIGAAVGGLGTFFAGMGILHLFGVKAIRPKQNAPKTVDED